MKFSVPIELDMEVFITKGKLDCIQIGQTKEWILNNFPAPDNRYDKDRIWNYGSFEFHFSKNQLSTIFCGDLSLTDSDCIQINKWILDECVTLSKFIAVLNNNRIDFRSRNSPNDCSEVEVMILSSKVNLCFFNGEDVKDINDLRLHSFSLSEYNIG